MADPATILTIISSSLTIIIRTATIGKTLHELKTKFQGADKAVRQLSVHISALRVAARCLSSWLEDETVNSEDIDEIKEEILEVIVACCELLSDVQDYVTKVLEGSDSLTFKGTVKYIWNEDVIRDLTGTLHQQETAIVLLLETLRIQRNKQREKLNEPDNVSVLQQAKRPSSSIFGLPGDQQSRLRYSVVSQDSGQFEVQFSFDTEVMASTVYRNCFTSLLKQNLHDQPKTGRASESIIIQSDPTHNAPPSSEPGWPLPIPDHASVIRYEFAEDTFWFVVEVVLQDGDRWELQRLYKDFYDLQISLIQQHPREAGNEGVERTLPYMPGPVSWVTENITQGRRNHLNAYIHYLFKNCRNLLQSDPVRVFFAPREGDVQQTPVTLGNVSLYDRPAGRANKTKLSRSLSQEGTS